MSAGSVGALAPYAGLLAEGLTALALTVPPCAQARLLAFGELLLKWNKVYNLTALRTPQELVTHHLLDSLAVLPYLPSRATLADIGSGGGLPGIALAIARPELAVTSIDTVQKKVSFQQQAKIELGLTRFVPVHARVEAFEPASPFDAVISRAFSELARFVALAGHLVAGGGRLYAMKGVYPGDELMRLPPGWRVAAIHPLEVPGLGAERHLIIVEKD